ncbi:MAG: aldose 1-epimerase family protein [Beijerinckiaceae bacterium]|jgi:galactose mutarotase-like enzyme
MVTLENAHLEAGVSSAGAELVHLRHRRGGDFLWDGDPVWWKGRAPLLFPIVGRVPDDHILAGGQKYPMRQHGLARISEFTLIRASGGDCVFSLESSPATHVHYPFDFRLEVTYALDGPSLSLSACVTNTGRGPMPVSFGFHPAFRWPLPGTAGKGAHSVVFDEAEPAPVRRLSDGLLMPELFPTPVEGRTVALRDSLFAADALVFDQLVSRGVTYRSTHASVRIAFPGMPHLGIWSRPGAGFVCIEPWHGYAAPDGFLGELAEKPGVSNVTPGSAATFSMSIAIEDES